MPIIFLIGFERALSQKGCCYVRCVVQTSSHADVLWVVVSIRLGYGWDAAGQLGWLVEHM
jgi:hypothetical protein